jgi:RHS repeat-associated protein
LVWSRKDRKSGNLCIEYRGRDADGTRVAKGTISTMSCDPATSGFSTTNDYILGSGGEQMTEMTINGSGSTLVWEHSNVWAGGKIIATYSQDNTGSQNQASLLHFYLDDPLGTRRVQTDYAGVVEKTCQSLPFGDGETCLATPTEHLFTGKERDEESGNDYFGYRYLSTPIGRWTSPDPSGLFFSDPGNPQSLNLYAYVQNHPLTFTDPNGLQVDPSATSSEGWLRKLLRELGRSDGKPPDEDPEFAKKRWTTHQPASGHYFVVGLYPPGAGWFGHMGDAVDTQNTNGWATAKNFTPLDRVLVMVGVPFAGMERSDRQTYASHLSGFGHPLYLYHPISDDQYASIMDRIAARYDSNYGMQHQYEVFLNSCGQNVSDDIRAAGINGAPPRLLFGPWLDYLWLRVQAH